MQRLTTKKFNAKNIQSLIFSDNNDNINQNSNESGKVTDSDITQSESCEVVGGDNHDGII